ncbi:MAG: DNA polymerase [Candidatus Kaiserbacteria bacterium]|nr:DNA polymerase [Candidatus Kaiserbacteria bacterium]
MTIYIDALALLYRAYHAIQNLSTSDGTPTGALFGFINSLLRVTEELKPDHIVACFDRPEVTHRQESFAGYKADREIPENDLIEQIEAAKQILQFLGVHVVEKAGYEADDLLGTLATADADRGEPVVIVTCDGDLLQLTVHEHIRVYFLRKGMSDFSILDSEGVAKKNGYSAERVVDYKGLAGDSSDSIPGVAGIGDTYAKRLISAYGNLDDIYRALDQDRLIEDGFTKRITTLLKEGRESAFLSRDLATIQTNVPIASIAKKQSWRDRVSVQEVHAAFDRYAFKDLLHRFTRLVGGDDGEEESRAGVQETGPEVREASIALWVLDAMQTDASAHEVLAYTGEQTISEASAHIKRKMQEKEVLSVWEDIERPLIPVVDRMKEVGIRFDTEGAHKLQKSYEKKIASIERDIYKHAGKEFNVSSPKQLGEVLYADLGLKPRRAAKTASGRKTTKESALLQLVDRHPIIPAVLSYRHYEKLRSTYVTALPRFVDSGGRIHTELIQNGTESGRFSSRDPNLQNIPASEGDGADIRNLFLATEGWTLVAIDYVQFELRIAAILSGDVALLKVFSTGGDVHQFAASEIFSIPEDAVSGEQRKHAKTINFSILYGTGVRSLQQSLGVTQQEATLFLKRYKDAFPELFSYMQALKEEAAEKQEVRTAFGRIRPVPEIASSIAYVRARAERVAMNSVIQGTAADIMKIAMIRIDELFEKKGVRDKARMLLQIHDELLLEVHPDAEDIVQEISIIMESVYPPNRNPISLPVTKKQGVAWGSLS